MGDTACWSGWSTGSVSDIAANEDLIFAHRVLPFFLFFFSSRRRHTRSDRDWSSDVCSSDLETVHVIPAQSVKIARTSSFSVVRYFLSCRGNRKFPIPNILREDTSPTSRSSREIGRASCRERV